MREAGAIAVFAAPDGGERYGDDRAPIAPTVPTPGEP